ncbi:unnamed protein product [Eruca vesicaria subsp. sativa]|uniref:Replication protein A 70 kDa DNA-binding subunit B/D first OB fold domain-containing protein n=1 Tax=Eruca vesicaria subsp. sativa TaxID=29727 RepID=A0ABC8KX19_ERUVS|nr:unnamed protein product [Eruca vesicaria subsp. sativa]
MARFSVLEELHAKTEEHAIRVKIVSKWNTMIRQRPAACVMILGDEKGSTMEATLPRDVVLPKGIDLEEADWFEIYNFKLIRVIELVRPTRRKYSIKFTQVESFRKIQPIVDSNFLELANFTAVLKGHSHPMYCIDLCGAMVAVGELQQLQELGPGEIYSYQNTRMELRNLRCVAYGKEAVTLSEYYRNSLAPVDVCVLRAWRIHWGEGGFRYVTNLEGYSQVVFDHDMEEIQKFKSKIPIIE